MRTRLLSLRCLALVFHVAAHPVLTLFVVTALGTGWVLREWFLVIGPIIVLITRAVWGSALSPCLPGLPIRPADEPELAALVKDIADDIGFGAPLAIRVAPVVDAGLVRTRFRSGHAFGLLIGWPLLMSCTIGELRAVIAHELAHEHHSTDPSAPMLAAREALVDSFDRAVHLPRALLAPLLHRTQPLSFEAELASDQVSSRVAGAAAAAAALRTTAMLSAAYDVLADRWLSALEARQERPVDLYEEMRQALGDPEVRRRLEQVALDAEPDEADPADSHPTIRARVSALGPPDVPAPGGALQLRSRTAIGAWCLRDLGFGDDATPVRLAELDLHQLREPGDDPDAELAAVTGVAPGAAALSAAVDAVADGRWAEMAEALEPSLRHSPDDLRDRARRSVFSRALGRALVPRLRDAGWRSANRWLASVLRGPDGEPVFVRDVIEAALRDADDRELRELLAVAHPPVAA